MALAGAERLGKGVVAGEAGAGTLPRPNGVVSDVGAVRGFVAAALVVPSMGVVDGVEPPELSPLEPVPLELVVPVPEVSCCSN